MSYYYLKNEEKNGLEIYFGGKPSEDILSRLKEAHWRWYPTKGCWYTKYSKEKENFAKEFAIHHSLPRPKVLLRKIFHQMNLQIRNLFLHLLYHRN